MSYYLYTGGVLKRVEHEQPLCWDRFQKNRDTESGLTKTGYLQCLTYKEHLQSLPSIAVSDDLKKVFVEGQCYEEGKDFTLEHWTGSAWWPNIHLVDGKAKPGTQQRAVNTLQEEKEDQEKIWEDVYMELVRQWMDTTYKGKSTKDFYATIKSKYHITRKQQGGK